MFENKTEQQARQEILDMVAAYCDTFHAPQPYAPGDRIGYAGRVYDREEMTNLADSMLDFWLTAGKYADRFEKELAAYLGVPFCSLVNSGSSANLLAFMALTSPLLGERAVRRGDEVITVAAGFPTTVAPIVQFGAVPVFVDVTIPQYNVNVAALEAAVSPRTKAVMLAHTLGNPFDVRTVRGFCRRHGLWLIEDNCDALGSEVLIDGAYRKTGTLGDIGTSSFYPPHHMTMGEGGAVYTADPLLHKIVRSLRDWGRDCVCPAGRDNFCGHRFDRQYGLLPVGYDHKYVYSHFGFNLKATDLQASVGCAQLGKLPGFVAKRRENYDALYAMVRDLDARFILPQALPDSRPSWFGFLLTCREGTDRAAVVRHLEEKGVQTRMLFAGNLLRHPCFDAIRDDPQAYRVAGPLDNTDRILRDSFWIGVYPGMDEKRLSAMADALHESVERS